MEKPINLKEYIIDDYYEHNIDAQESYQIRQYLEDDSTVEMIQDLLLEHGIEISYETTGAILDAMMDDLVETINEMDNEACEDAREARKTYLTAQGVK